MVYLHRFSFVLSLMVNNCKWRYKNSYTAPLHGGYLVYTSRINLITNHLCQYIENWLFYFDMYMYMHILFYLISTNIKLVFYQLTANYLLCSKHKIVFQTLWKCISKRKLFAGHVCYVSSNMNILLIWETPKTALHHTVKSY